MEYKVKLSTGKPGGDYIYDVETTTEKEAVNKAKELYTNDIELGVIDEEDSIVCISVKPCKMMAYHIYEF